MTPSERDSWERIRANGRDQYILREGLLRDGLVAGICVILGHVFADMLRGKVPTLWQPVVEGAATVLAIGWWSGARSWREHEDAYHEANKALQATAAAPDS
jgi:hypothetical protein